MASSFIFFPHSSNTETPAGKLILVAVCNFQWKTWLHVHEAFQEFDWWIHLTLFLRNKEHVSVWFPVVFKVFVGTDNSSLCYCVAICQRVDLCWPHTFLGLCVSFWNIAVALLWWQQCVGNNTVSGGAVYCLRLILLQEMLQLEHDAAGDRCFPPNVFYWTFISPERSLRLTTCFSRKTWRT